MELNDLRTDVDLETGGVWVPLSESARVKVARVDNPKHRARMQELLEPWLEVIQNGDLPDGKMVELGVEAMADAILLDFEGITDGGEPVENTRENRVEMLKIRDFREAVQARASNIALFRAKKVNGVVGNSPSSSAGDSAAASRNSGSGNSKRKKGGRSKS